VWSFLRVLVKLQNETEQVSTVVDVYAQRTQFSSRLSDGVISIRMSTENYKSAPIGFTMSLSVCPSNYI
jgi:hypothetical protein